jgi:hypothetical protein
LFEEEGKAVPEPEAPKDAEYGQYLFAPLRDEEGVPYEKNTEPENKLLTYLGNHFANNNGVELGSIAPEVLDVLAKHQYEPLLDPGKRKVFRAISLPDYVAEDLVKSTGETVVRGEVGVCRSIGTLRPATGSKIQSWTTTPDSGPISSLIQDTPSRTHAALLFVAYPHGGGNKFFGRPYDLAKVVAPEFAEEYETISFGLVEYVGFSYFIPTVASTLKKVREDFKFKDLIEKAKQLG